MRVIIGSWGHKVAIEVGLKESVVEIKTKIEQLLGVPVASQTLAVCGLELLDGLDMEDYPIVTEGTKIDLTIRYWMSPPNFYHSGKIQIIIKFSARQLHIEVDRTETVRSLKEKYTSSMAPLSKECHSSFVESS
ncbi:hypothetical protein RchiOBHm_Chr2g0126881 [Rosa chinensis]|uniref:Ubiquitin-like domain-containing protein n=1 Tax=Rosa chinensis TaxID=74649 RepID=A0A2P6RU02_ROSCH|nr:hypothetical protein RchiOBHm_Chr2g0126881 [Rosa chinensis]